MHKFIPTLLLVLLGSALIGLAFAFNARMDTRTSPATDTEPRVTDQKNGKETITLNVDGVDREFIVYRPTNVPADEELPVVFMFHGSGGTGEKFYDISGWKEKADEEGILVVFPTALKYHVFDEEKVVQGEVRYDVAVYQTKWNDFHLETILDPDYPNQTLYDDVHFVQEMVAYVKDAYAVDEARFYATGFSNGAGFTARLVVQLSDTFAAFAPSGAGRVSPDALTYANDYTDAPFTPRPVALMLGELDPKLTHAAGIDAFPMDESFADPDGTLKKAVIDPYLSLLGLADTYTYENQPRVSHFAYEETASGEGTQEFHLIVMENMKHLYPNGTNYALSATDLFWPFFEQHSL